MNNELSAWLELFLQLAIGSTVVLASGLLTILVCRRQSSATKHLVASLACVALLLLPIAVAVLPSWRFGLLEVPSAQRTPSKSFVSSTSELSVEAEAMSPDLSDSLDAAEIPTNSLRKDAWSPEPQRTFPFASYLLGIYLFGVTYGLLRLIGDHISARRLTANSQIFVNTAIKGVISGVRDTRLCHRVQVRTTEQVSVPMVTGILWPTILLPDSATDWPADQVRSALAHELAHVERHDIAVQLIAKLAAIIYWPQPLIHLLVTIMRTDREIACDDKALANCLQRTQYARHLLEFAVELRNCNRDRAGTLAMARDSNVERRITAILSSTRRRSPPTKRAVALMLISMLACLFGSAFVSPFSDIGVSNVAAQENQTTAETLFDENQTNAQSINHTFIGRVLQPNGQPAHGVTVEYPGMGNHFPSIQVVTDEEGKFALTAKPRAYHPPIIAKATGNNLLGVAQTSGDEDASNRSFVRDVGDVTLKPAKRINVQVLDDDRIPVEHAAVIVQASFGTIDRFITNSQGQALIVYPDGLNLQIIGAVKSQLGCDYRGFKTTYKSHPNNLLQGFEGDLEFILNGVREASVQVIGPDGRPLAGIRLDPWYIEKPGRGEDWNQPSLDEFSRITDDKGVAVFDMLPSDLVKGIQIFPRLNRDDWFVIGTSFHGITNGSAYVNWDQGNSATVHVAEKVLVGGRVLLPDGQPVENVQIAAAGDFFYSSAFHEVAQSDSEGLWEMLVQPNGYYLFVVQDDDYCAPAHEGILVHDSETPTNINFQLEAARRVFGKVSGPIDKTTSVMLQQTIKRYSHDNFPPDQRLPNPEFNNNPSAFTQISHRVAADGTFEFKVGPGEFVIWSPDRKTQKFTITSELEKEFNFELQRPLRGPVKIRVLVAGEPSEPVANAKVFGYGTEFPFRGRIDAVTGPDGCVDVLHDLVETSIVVESPDRRFAAQSRLGADDNELIVTVVPSATVTGRLLGSNNEPMANVRLEYGLELKSDGGRYTKLNRSKSSTNADGQFELRGLCVGVSYWIEIVPGIDSNGNEESVRTIRTITPKETVLDLGDIKSSASVNF